MQRKVVGPVSLLSNMIFEFCELLESYCLKWWTKEKNIKDKRNVGKNNKPYNPSQCRNPKLAEWKPEGWTNLHHRQHHGGLLKTSYKPRVLWNIPVAIGSKVLAVMLDNKKASILGSQPVPLPLKAVNWGQQRTKHAHKHMYREHLLGRWAESDINGSCLREFSI